MVGDEEVRAEVGGLRQGVVGDIEADGNFVDVLLYIAHEKARVVPGFLGVKGRNRIDELVDVSDSRTHRQFLLGVGSVPRTACTSRMTGSRSSHSSRDSG